MVDNDSPSEEKRRGDATDGLVEPGAAFVVMCWIT
jgi:hypothetical protein